MRWKIGDVVRLKSGGPSMTLQAIVPSGGVVCSWFDGGKLTSQSFAPEALVEASQPEVKVTSVKPDKGEDYAACFLYDRRFARAGLASSLVERLRGRVFAVIG